MEEHAEIIAQSLEVLLHQTVMVGWVQIVMGIAVAIAAVLGSRWAWKKWSEEEADTLFALILINLVLGIFVVALLSCGVYAVAFPELALADTLTP